MPRPTSPPPPRHLRRGVVQVNAYFAARPEMVLGPLAQRRGIYGPGLSTTVLPHPEAGPLEAQLDAALARLPRDIFAASAESSDEIEDEPAVRPGTAAESAAVKEGSFFIGRAGVLMQIVESRSVPVAIREGKEGSGGITPKAAKIIRALLPIRDAVREVLRAQASDRPWREHQVKLRVAYSTFIRFFGPINHTVITTTTDPKTGEERETHRRPNLAPFADDPDCWLVASIEDYDLDSGLARMGPVFRERVVAPPAAPVITSAADALAVTLNQVGRVDPDHLAELLERDPDDALAELGTAVFRNPRTEQWETADAYLSGAVRSKLATAKEAAALDPQYQRNVTALLEVQPEDLRPSDITARLGAPWIPTDVVETFAGEVMDGACTGPAHRGHGDVERRRRGIHRQCGGHLDVGHAASPRGNAAARCTEQRHPADLGHHPGRRGGKARPQRRGHRGRQGEAGQDQGGLHHLDLDRSGPHRPARPN